MHRTLLIFALIFALLLLPAACCAEEAENGFADELPARYYRAATQRGTVNSIVYDSRDYTGDGAVITKNALVYLPCGYDENERYDVLILCHGVGGTENEWGFRNSYCVGRNIVDNLIERGEAKPFIIVCPNGRSCANCYDTSMNNAASFYAFGQELRNDLLPYIDAHYATYGSDTPNDLSASREHRAMAGLSMGGMQTINIGLCECLDLFSAFGAFSAAPTSYKSSVIATKLKAFGGDWEIRAFYSVCGLEDSIAYAAASDASKDLKNKTALLDDGNCFWHEIHGTHSFTVWNLGLYNFVKLLNRA